MISARRTALAARFPEWTSMALHQRLERCAEEFADRPLVITDDRTVTYAETAVWVERLADGLVTMGVRPGDRVGLVLANYLEFVPLKFAVSRAGAIAIPFNFLYRTAELRYVLGQSQCQWLVSMTAFADLDYAMMLDEIAPGWDVGDQQALPFLREVVLLDTGGPDTGGPDTGGPDTGGPDTGGPDTGGRGRAGVRSLADVEALGEAHAGASATVPTPHPDDVADILYTSGTTGSPKGVLITHDASQRTGYASALTRAFDDGWRILFSLPCYHMFGYVEGLMAALMVGGAIIPQTSFDPGRYLEGIERHRATDILCVPTMTVALLEHPDVATRDLSSLTAILSGAAPAPVWLWEKVRTALGVDEIVTGYGMTETGGAMTLTLPEDPLELLSSTVGRVKLAGVAGLPETAGEHTGDITEYRTFDVTTGEMLPVGVEGELAARGPSNMLGFYGKPEETALALDGLGWVRSGDLGYVRPDHYVVLTGRSKELYKSGGELVMPKEVEEVISRHPGVSQAYAVGVADERWGEVGVACVVRKPEATVGAEEILALCRGQLARFKVPKRVLFLEASALPTTPTGKVQKFRLARMAADDPAAEERAAQDPAAQDPAAQDPAAQDPAAQDPAAQDSAV